MNRVIASILVLILMLLSCGEKKKVVDVPVYTKCPPSPPRGIYAINLDGYVRICWYSNPETEGVELYIVYRAAETDEYYTEIGSVTAGDPEPLEYCYDDTETDYDKQYYYAVAAYNAGGEGDVGYEITGTPRPEGLLTLYNYDDLPGQSGYDFSGLSNTPQSHELATTDIYFGVDAGAFEIIAFRSGVDIQDYGYVGDFDFINYAPADGWSPSRKVEAIVGHCYILRMDKTVDGYHYAKVYVTEVNANFVTFLWAYQTNAGNRDLAPSPGGGEGGKSVVKRPGETGSDSGLENKKGLIGRQFPPIVKRG